MLKWQDDSAFTAVNIAFTGVCHLKMILAVTNKSVCYCGIQITYVVLISKEHIKHTRSVEIVLYTGMVVLYTEYGSIVY